MLIGLPEPDIEERYFNYLIRVWTQPVLWLLVAMLLGTFRARQIEQRDELLLQAENLRMRGATLLDHANNLRGRCTMLERRVAMRETTDTAQLLSALARLGGAGPGRWADALEAALASGFPQSQISLYAFERANARLVLCHQRAASGQSAMGAPNDIASDHPLLAEIRAGRPVSILTPEHDQALRGNGVAAVPIFSVAADTAEPRVIGMLKADVLPPNQIDAATTARLSVIAAHLSPALQRGLISPVADTAGPQPPQAVPVVRRWRLAKLIAGASQPDGTHG